MVEKNGGRGPRVMVMGALGRCGTGACDFAQLAGIPEYVLENMYVYLFLIGATQ